MGGEIAPGVTLFGEYCYAVHSIVYERLPGYFFLIAVREDEAGEWWAWDRVMDEAGRLGVPAAPELFRGVVSGAAELERLTRRLGAEPSVFGGEREGVVVRVARGFSGAEFGEALGKYVRADHVRTDDHWMFQPIRPQRGPGG
jgi:hypothetical protein